MKIQKPAMLCLEWTLRLLYPSNQKTQATGFWTCILDQILINFLKLSTILFLKWLCQNGSICTVQPKTAVFQCTVYIPMYLVMHLCYILLPGTDEKYFWQGFFAIQVNTIYDIIRFWCHILTGSLTVEERLFCYSAILLLDETVHMYFLVAN